MFSGIVKGMGRIEGVEDRGGDRRLWVGFQSVIIEDLEPGRSVAVNGVCLTATECRADRFAADVSTETLAVTTLGNAGRGDLVNLEPALRLGEGIDGHFVTGHVDGVGEIASLEESARSLKLSVRMPASLVRYVARKGSIAVDGVSLTVNSVSKDRFEVNIVPHTKATTVIRGYAKGTPVNIEIDMIARYLGRLLGQESEGINLDLLKQHGFAGNN